MSKTVQRLIRLAKEELNSFKKFQVPSHALYLGAALITLASFALAVAYALTQGKTDFFAAVTDYLKYPEYLDINFPSQFYLET